MRKNISIDGFVADKLDEIRNDRNVSYNTAIRILLNDYEIIDPVCKHTWEKYEKLIEHEDPSVIFKYGVTLERKNKSPLNAKKPLPMSELF